MAYTVNAEQLIRVADLLRAGDARFRGGRVDREERYKYEIYDKARLALSLDSWREAEPGSGHIAKCVKAAIDANGNLVDYRSKDIEAALNADLRRGEQILFDLFLGTDDERSFGDFVHFFGRHSDLVSYLFFIKDKERYLPCRPSAFDTRLSWIGIASSCLDTALTWQSYREFIEIIGVVQAQIQPFYSDEISLLDAHSFVWSTWMVLDACAQLPPCYLDYSLGVIHISTEQWLELLRRGTIGRRDIEYLSKFYAAPFHAASCKQLGQAEGVKPSTFISRCVSIARRVSQALRLPELTWASGRKKYYPILFLGRYSYDRPSCFEWQLRPELVAALESAHAEILGDAVQRQEATEQALAEKLDRRQLFRLARKAPDANATTYTTTTTQRHRNVYVAEAAKARARGKCQLCGAEAPFTDRDGKPYLESHHVVWLSRNGHDTLSNVVALCPNCHRRMHIVDVQEDIAFLQEVLRQADD